MTRRGLREAATIIMVAATAACAPGLIPPGHATATSPPVSSPTPSTEPSATPTREPATPPATVHLAPRPPGTQWAANSIVHLRFAVPDTWTVLDPTKLHTADLAHDPGMRLMAARIGVTADQLAAQVSSARIFTVSGSRPPADITLTDVPVTGLPTDEAVTQQFLMLTGSTKNIHISRRQTDQFGQIIEVRLVVPVPGRAPLQADTAMFTAFDGVFVLFATATDRPTVDRLYNQAMNSMDMY